MSDMHAWLQDKEAYGWEMPAAPWWKKLPIIRHVRAIWAKIQVERWYSHGPGLLGIRSGYDDWIVYGIFHGKER